MEAIRSALENAAEHPAEHPATGLDTPATAAHVDGLLSVRVRIEITASNATGDELRELVHGAESRSPVGDAIARAVDVTTEVVTD